MGVGVLADRVAIVTGGTSGIGRAAALAFAREGARVIVSGRREVEGADTAALLHVSRKRLQVLRAQLASSIACASSTA